MRLISQIRKEFNNMNIMKDTMAGIIIALVSIPIAMGYSGIAGLPAVYGLYGSILPILVFGLLSTSPQFVVGIDAMPAVMVGAVLSELAIEGESKEALSVVPVITFLVMIWFVIFYFLKAGRIVKYISTPVMGGFISGVGLTIIVMQIPKLFGGSTGQGEIFVLIGHIIDEIGNFNLISFCLGIGTVIIILIFKKILPKLPMTVIMLVVGAVLQMTFHLDEYGVKLLPEVSSGLPDFIIPDFSLIRLEPRLFILESFSIAAVIMAQTLLATGNYSMKYGDKVDNNKEILAYAGMNLASCIIGCPPINGSVSRSGIADSFGARSQIISISASITMLIVLLFATPLLNLLPVPILTGIVMTALIGILEIKLSKRLWNTSKKEWFIFFLSFLSVLVFGTIYGVLIGLTLSFADVALQATYPPTAYLGRIPGQGNFYALDRNSLARPIKGAVIYRFSGNLLFANIDKFQSDIENSIKEDTKCIIVDARGVSNIDITAVDRLLIISDNLHKKGVEFFITEHSGHVNDDIRMLGGARLVNEGRVRRTITLALREMGIEKPYILEESNEEIANVEPDEMLAEFEWAFGKDAENKLKEMAEKKAEELAREAGKLQNIDNEKDIDKLNGADDLLSSRLDTRWGHIGRFDESEFWDLLEFRLEELKNEGKLSGDLLDLLERRIEARRIHGEKRLQSLNPHALELLRKHREAVRNRLRNINTEEFEHMQKLQKENYERLRRKDPELAEKLKELYENNK